MMGPTSFRHVALFEWRFSGCCSRTCSSRHELPNGTRFQKFAVLLAEWPPSVSGKRELIREKGEGKRNSGNSHMGNAFLMHEKKLDARLFLVLNVFCFFFLY